MESSWHEVLKAKTLREREEERKGEERDICTDKKEEKTSPPGYFFIGTVKDFLKGTVLERKCGKESLEKENLGKGTR